eukprot:4959697-Prymnesium_polylepis.1
MTNELLENAWTAIEELWKQRNYDPPTKPKEIAERLGLAGQVRGDRVARPGRDDFAAPVATRGVGDREAHHQHRRPERQCRREAEGVAQARQGHGGAECGTAAGKGQAQSRSAAASQEECATARAIATAAARAIAAAAARATATAATATDATTEYAAATCREPAGRLSRRWRSQRSILGKQASPRDPRIPRPAWRR